MINSLGFPSWAHTNLFERKRFRENIYASKIFRENTQMMKMTSAIFDQNHQWQMHFSDYGLKEVLKIYKKT